MRKNAVRLLSLLLSLALVVSCLCVPGFAITAAIIGPDRFGVGKTYKVSAGNLNDYFDWYDLYDAQGNLLYLPSGGMELEPAGHPITPAELSQLAQQRQSAMEGRYACRIQWNGIYNNLDKIFFLQDLEAEFQKIPAALLEATTKAVRDKMGTFTLVLVGQTNGGRDGLTTWDGANAKIELYGKMDALVHEYGHLIHLTILDARYGASALQNTWTAQNGGVAYGDYPGYLDWDYYREYYNDENPVFVTAYAGTSYREDFADTFDCIMGDGWPGMVLTYEFPNSTAVKKMAYLRQLLSEAFGVSVSVFPSTDPNRPSSWAEAGVQEYLDLFYSGPLADSRVFYPGYQSGATRRAFAKAAHTNVISQIYWDIPMNDWDAKNAFDEKWHIFDDYMDINAEYSIPFTDLSGGYFSAIDDHSVLALYLNGVVNGTSATTFNPDGTITRQEAATMLYRLCKALGYQFPDQGAVFADDSDVASWAKEAVSAVAAAGIMNGVGNNRFDPKAVYTYEQSALTMVRVYKLLSGK